MCNFILNIIKILNCIKYRVQTVRFSTVYETTVSFPIICPGSPLKKVLGDSLQPPSLQSNPLSRCHLTYYTIHRRDNVGASSLVFLKADNAYFLTFLKVRKKKFLSSRNLRNCNFLLSYHLLIFKSLEKLQSNLQ